MSARSLCSIWNWSVCETNQKVSQWRGIWIWKISQYYDVEFEFEKSANDTEFEFEKSANDTEFEFEKSANDVEFEFEKSANDVEFEFEKSQWRRIWNMNK